MNFNQHLEIEGKHAFLGPSKFSWLNYTEEKLDLAYVRFLAAQKGTRLHAFASECIKLDQKLPSRTKKTLNLYVNDAIGFKMDTEVGLKYSENCFGTVDAISFRNHWLRIHDLKTGITPAHMEQLDIYAALFCLEYEINPRDIRITLCLYQLDEVLISEPEPEYILSVMGKIIMFDKQIERLKIGD